MPVLVHNMSPRDNPFRMTHSRKAATPSEWSNNTAINKRNGNHLRIVNRRTHVVNTSSVTYVSRGSSCATRGTTGSLSGSSSQRYRARSSTYWRLQQLQSSKGNVADYSLFSRGFSRLTSTKTAGGRESVTVRYRAAT